MKKIILLVIFCLSPFIYGMNIDYDELWAAIQGNDLQGVADAMGKGANIEIRDSDGWTALYLALKEGYIDMVSFLISKGANVNSKDNNGRSILRLAIRVGKPDLVSVLLSAPKIKVTLEDVENAKEFVELTKRDFIGTNPTPQQIEAYNNRAEILNILIEHLKNKSQNN